MVVSIWLLVVVLTVASFPRGLGTRLCSLSIINIQTDHNSRILSAGRFGTLSSKHLACVRDLVKVSVEVRVKFW